MIQRAVAARPDDGYITDSLGWVFYRLGRYDEAVVEMERAAELMPVDPVINDHLGDVYWAVGRKREARVPVAPRDVASSPRTEDATRIRRKLEVGLDAVLKEEGAAAACGRQGAAERLLGAPAKVNLTLHVTGRRADGYHLLDSLVAFADAGRPVSVARAERCG